MHDTKEQLRLLAEHYFAESEPVSVDVDLALATGHPTARWWLAAAAVVAIFGVVAAVTIARPSSGERTDTGPVSEPTESDNSITDESRQLSRESLENALLFRSSVVNGTGAVHLSMSDAIEIATRACFSAVNDEEQLLALGGDLRSFGSDQNAAQSIWLAARQLCPDEFADQDFPLGLPSGGGEGENAPESVPLLDLPDDFPDFIDLSVLDETSFQWTEGRQLIVSSTTTLGGDEAVEYFRSRFPDGWTVNEVLGPVTDRNGLKQRSLDIAGEAWSGMVEVGTGEFEDLPLTTFVTIVLSAGADPFSDQSSPAQTAALFPGTGDSAALDTDPRSALAVLFLDGTAALFDSATEDPVATSDTALPQDLIDEPVRDLLFLDGSWLAATCCEPVDGTIHRFGDVELRPVLSALHMSLSPDGRRIAHSSSQGVKISAGNLSEPGESVSAIPDGGGGSLTWVDDDTIAYSDGTSIWTLGVSSGSEMPVSTTIDCVADLAQFDDMLLLLDCNGRINVAGNEVAAGEVADRAAADADRLGQLVVIDNQLFGLSGDCVLRLDIAMASERCLISGVASIGSGVLPVPE